MSDFSFTSTAQCDLCGEYLSSSSEDCGHGGVEPKKHVFRELRGGRESIVGVEAAGQYRWHKLYEKVGDDWIGYVWLGTKDEVNSMLRGNMWDDVSELPHRAMSLDAPKDVGKD